MTDLHLTPEQERLALAITDMLQASAAARILDQQVDVQTARTRNGDLGLLRASVDRLESRRQAGKEVATSGRPRPGASSPPAEAPP
jgi:hypothetical protein